MKEVRLMRYLRFLLSVPRCAVCRQLLAAEDVMRGFSGADVLCAECRAEWEREKLLPCDGCGLAAIDCRCMPPALEQAGAATLICLGDYTAESAVGRMILRLKRDRLRRAAAFAAAQLSAGVKREAMVFGFSVEQLTVTWTPRSKKAKRENGHDQAEMLARALAKKLGCVCQPLLVRASDSGEQKRLGAAERAENVSAVFSRNPQFDVRGRRVLVVDDVVTTGATLARACSILYADGAELVLCVALGRSRLRKNQK